MDQRRPDRRGGSAHAQLALPFDSDAPRLARRFVADTLRCWQATERLDDAVLLTSELVANAIQHGSPQATLQLIRTGPTVRIKVRDACHSWPTVGRLDVTDAASGRGMALVQRLADAWGVDPVAPAGKAVWFSLAPVPTHPEQSAQPVDSRRR